MESYFVCCCSAFSQLLKTDFSGFHLKCIWFSSFHWYAYTAKKSNTSVSVLADEENFLLHFHCVFVKPY